MGLALLDSSVVVAYLDADDLLHASAAGTLEKTLRAGTGLAISAITWAELLHGAFLGHRNETVVREFAAGFGIEILAADAAVAERAAEIQAAYAQRAGPERPRRLKTPDALILSTADIAGDVEIVICGDDKWRKVPGIRPKIELIRE